MPEQRKIRVLLVDDHALVREGIRSSMATHAVISIIGEAANGKEAVKKCKALRPDVVLLDINMPEMGGIEAAPLISRASPHTRIIALTVHDSREYVSGLLRAGAHGYVLKDASPDELVHAILSVGGGKAFFSPAVSKIVLDDYVAAPGEKKAGGKISASDREAEVLRMVAQGKTSKEIAAALKLSSRTVETYRVRLKRKLNARNVAEMLKNARERGLV